MTDPDPQAIDLLTPYERLACYRCLDMKVSKDKRYAWCEQYEPEFPLMCNQYRGTHG
jgi:hypothetical protein